MTVCLTSEGREDWKVLNKSIHTCNDYIIGWCNVMYSVIPGNILGIPGGNEGRYFDQGVGAFP